jgi:hypothetical protein
LLTHIDPIAAAVPGPENTEDEAAAAAAGKPAG